MRKSDFDRYAGHLVKIETEIPIEGRKRFRGLLIGTDGEAARLRQEDTKEDTKENAAVTGVEVLLPISEISEAKLVLTDELVRQALRREKSAKRDARAAKREQRRHKSNQGD